MSIRFGTSGWRAIIAEDFTFKNVELVTNSICRYLKTSTDGRLTMVVGNDSRFMGERFAAKAAEIVAGNGINVLLCDGPTPTPAISHAIRSRSAAGGINFTASHNPPEYQGIKFSTSDGAPALPEATREIERLIEAGEGGMDGSSTGKIDNYNAAEDYLADLSSKVDLAAISRAGGSYAYDPLWGTGRGYLDRCLREAGVTVEVLNDWRDVLFGGRSPEPGRDHLKGLSELVVSKGLALGLATDGDGDRFGIIDSDGSFIEPNQLVALLTDYLAESRGWTEGVARSVATSHLVDRVARARGIELHETPVGFKFIGELINEDAIILGGEESAGLSIKGHYPEKDGLLACLLAAEAVAVRGASLGEQLNELYKKVGKLVSGRIGLKLTPEVADKLGEKLGQTPEAIGDRKVNSINRMDGVKFLLDNDSWILMRPSGTEPMVRIYAESENEKDLEELLEQGRRYLLD